MVAPDEPAEQGRLLATPACSGVDRARGVVWVGPTATVEVQFNELIRGRLRDAVLRGAVEVQFNELMRGRLRDAVLRGVSSR